MGQERSRKTYTREALNEIVKDLWPKFVGKNFKVVGCYVNSFLHEKSGKMRHDVLLKLEEGFTQFMEDERDKFRKKNVSMDPPHITHSIHWVKADAFMECANICKLLPLEVELIGISVN